MNLRDAEAVLNALPRFTDEAGKAYKPGLERIEALLAGMGRPQDDLDTIHVAGTNGKGTTASILAAIGTSAGRRIGLHTSPHLFHVTERMRVDGAPAPASWLAAAVDRYRELAFEVRPSYFEFTFALSMRYFADVGADVAVVEVGMGGRLDATNILQPVLCIITEIGLDHAEFLGSTIEEIAAEKAGIIKNGVPVVTSALPEAAEVVAEVAAQRDAPLHRVADEVETLDAAYGLHGVSFTARTPVRTYEGLFLGLAGGHQVVNAAAALRAAELISGKGFVLDNLQKDGSPVFDGMRRVRELSGLRGRLELVHEDPLIVADVAHNADGIAAALDHMEAVRDRTGRLLVLLGVMADKDVDAIARSIAAAGARVRPVALESPRAMAPAELASRLRGSQIETDPPSTVEIGVRDFIATANPSDALLLTGSHLVFTALEGRTW